jgi:hypothetical protein
VLVGAHRCSSLSKFGLILSRIVHQRSDRGSESSSARLSVRYFRNGGGHLIAPALRSAFLPLRSKRVILARLPTLRTNRIFGECLHVL